MGHLIGDLNSAVNVILRNIMDAATLQNDGNCSNHDLFQNLFSVFSRFGTKHRNLNLTVGLEANASALGCDPY